MGEGCFDLFHFFFFFSERFIFWPCRGPESFNFHQSNRPLKCYCTTLFSTGNPHVTRTRMVPVCFFAINTRFDGEKTTRFVCRLCSFPCLFFLLFCRVLLPSDHAVVPLQHSYIVRGTHTEHTDHGCLR